MKNYKRPVNIGQRKKCSWIHIESFVGTIYNHTLSAMKMKNDDYAFELKSINQALGQKTRTIVNVRVMGRA